MSNIKPVSVNQLSESLLKQLIDREIELGIKVFNHHTGVQIIDAGIEVNGSISAGIKIGEICMGGLGLIHLKSFHNKIWPTWLTVYSNMPVISCLGSQYAGWSLTAKKEETGGKSFFCLGSGPARSLACREDLFKDIAYKDSSTSGILIMEVEETPPEIVIRKILKDCGLTPNGLTIILTPTKSFSGTTQVVSRVLEVALHKAHTLGFDLNNICEGIATAPLPSPGVDFMTSMGRTNDAILYGGIVHLWVKGSESDAKDLANKLPSINSKDYGCSFSEIFRNVEFDFYKIDPDLFAPAEVWISNLESGKTWNTGKLNLDLLVKLWL
tara:strand:- start:395 stop:1372 length:978 start_codon:yes stop_codon:yes gene_type:complete